MTLATHGKVLTAIVGSYPKPRYVYPRNGRSLLDSFGFALDRRRQEIGSAEFARLLDRAALEAIKDQDRAGIDIVTDGEERRGHYVLHIVNRLAGHRCPQPEADFDARRHGTPECAACHRKARL